MEAHAIGAQLGEAVHGVDRVEWRAYLGAEGITTRVPHRPKPEGEMVFWYRCEGIGHGSPVVASLGLPGVTSPCVPR